jgi:hypothetical protein
LEIMSSHRVPFNSSADRGGAAGWTALHQALQAGIPYAAQILAILDRYSFQFPWAPTFCCQDTELPSYRLVHRAWREGRLSALLYLLQAWREPGGKLPADCCRSDFQHALFDFLQIHHRQGLESLRSCLSQQPLPQMPLEPPAAFVEVVRHHFESVWETHRRGQAA